MDEQLSTLLREVILAAQSTRQDPVKLAEEAVRAYKAGQAVYRNPISKEVSLSGTSSTKVPSN